MKGKLLGHNYLERERENSIIIPSLKTIQSTFNIEISQRFVKIRTLFSWLFP